MLCLFFNDSLAVVIEVGEESPNTSNGDRLSCFGVSFTISITEVPNENDKGIVLPKALA
jgi:hypothetical protein